MEGLLGLDLVLAHLDSQALALVLALRAQAAHAEGHEDEAHVQSQRRQQDQDAEGRAQPARHAPLLVVGAERDMDGYPHVRHGPRARGLPPPGALLDERIGSRRPRPAGRVAARRLTG